jgi:hypothetical protein
MPPGRPRKELNETEIYKLAQIGCTFQEIADWYGVSKSTIERNYDGIIKEGWSNLNMSLKRAQVKKALEGNPTMLIWLGKVLLQQKDTASMFTVTKDDSKLIIDLSGDAKDGTTSDKTDSN